MRGGAGHRRAATNAAGRQGSCWAPAQQPRRPSRRPHLLANVTLAVARDLALLGAALVGHLHTSTHKPTNIRPYRPYTSGRTAPLTLAPNASTTPPPPLIKKLPPPPRLPAPVTAPQHAHTHTMPGPSLPSESSQRPDTPGPVPRAAARARAPGAAPRGSRRAAAAPRAPPHSPGSAPRRRRRGRDRGRGRGPARAARAQARTREGACER